MAALFIRSAVPRRICHTTTFHKPLPLTLSLTKDGTLCVLETAKNSLSTIHNESDLLLPTKAASDDFCPHSGTLLKDAPKNSEQFNLKSQKLHTLPQREVNDNCSQIFARKVKWQEKVTNGSFVKPPAPPLGLPVRLRSAPGEGGTAHVSSYPTMPAVSPRRAHFHSSASAAVTFKSRIQTQVPKVNFFDYAMDLDDIPGKESHNCIIDGLSDWKMTFGEAKAKSERLGRAMLARGYRPGDIVAIISPNCIEFVLTMLGCAYAGITVTLMNPLDVQQHHYQLLHTNAKAIFVFPLLARNVAKVVKELPPNQVQDVFLYGFPFTHRTIIESYRRLFIRHVNSSYFSVLLRAGNPGLSATFKRPEVDPEQDALVLPFSSGTTGSPKAVIQTHASMVGYVDTIYRHPVFQKMALEENYSFNTLMLLPFFHIFGFGMLGMSLKFGATAVTLPRFQPQLFLSRIQKYQPRGLAVVPPLVKFMAYHPLVDKYDTSSIRMLFSGAAPLSKVDADNVMLRYPHMKVEQGLGMTEGAVSCTASLENDSPLMSVGRLLPNGEAKVLDVETREELDHNEVGEIALRSPSVMKGYFKNPSATAETFFTDDEGKQWLLTGDIGYFDEYDNLNLVDRIKEMIKYKGHQVSPVQMEQTVKQLADVADVAIVGVEDDVAGEVPLAFVIKAKTSLLSDTELISKVTEHVSANMNAYHAVRGGVVVLPDNGILRSLAGKILRRQMKEKIPPELKKRRARARN